MNGPMWRPKGPPRETQAQDSIFPLSVEGSYPPASQLQGRPMPSRSMSSHLSSLRAHPGASTCVALIPPCLCQGLKRYGKHREVASCNAGPAEDQSSPPAETPTQDRPCGLTSLPSMPNCGQNGTPLYYDMPSIHMPEEFS